MKLDEEAVLQLDDTYFVQEMLTPAAFKFKVIGLVKALCLLESSCPLFTWYS